MFAARSPWRSPAFLKHLHMDLCRGITTVPPVVFSAARPDDAVDDELASVSPLDRAWPVGVESKSAKRRRRMRNSASLKSQLRSQEVLACLRAEACHEPAPTEQGISEILESRFFALESKLDLVLSVLSGSSMERGVAWSPEGLVYLDHVVQTKGFEQLPESTPSLEQVIEDSNAVAATAQTPVTDAKDPISDAPVDLSFSPEACKAEADALELKVHQRDAALHRDPACTRSYKSPWQFLDILDCASASQTCSHSLWLVGTHTPLRHIDSDQELNSLCSGPVNEQPTCIIAAKWRGDHLCMDNVVDYFSTYGKCEPLDWSVVDGQNVVPLLFQDERAAVATLSPSTHKIQDDKGRMISVSAE